MPISCHFRNCKALLVTSLTHVSGAIIQQVPRPLPLAVKPLKRSGMDHTDLAEITPRRPLPRKRSPDGATTDC